jgi:hypothetical protein
VAVDTTMQRIGHDTAEAARSALRAAGRALTNRRLPSEETVPYFIYRVLPPRRLERVTDKRTFGEASIEAKALRASPDLPAGCTIKVVFAADEAEAERLLAQARAKEPGLAGDE